MYVVCTIPSNGHTSLSTALVRLPSYIILATYFQYGDALVSDEEIEPASTYYVSTDGDDTLSCKTKEASCKTLVYVL